MCLKPRSVCNDVAGIWIRRGETSRCRSILQLVTRITCYTDYVANLTLAIDDELLRRARIRALESGTSVNAAVRDFLVAYTGPSQQDSTVRTLIELAADAGATNGGGDRRWTREDIYEERAGR